MKIGRLRAAGAAIGVGRNGVGEDALADRVDGADVVERRSVMRQAADRDVRPELVEVGAHVGDQLDAHRLDAAVGVEREGAGRDVVAAVRVGQEMLVAVGHPFDRPAERLRRLHRQRIFPVVEAPWCRSRRRHPA